MSTASNNKKNNNNNNYNKIIRKDLESYGPSPEAEKRSAGGTGGRSEPMEANKIKPDNMQHP